MNEQTNQNIKNNLTGNNQLDTLKTELNNINQEQIQNGSRNALMEAVEDANKIPELHMNSGYGNITSSFEDGSR